MTPQGAPNWRRELEEYASWSRALAHSNAAYLGEYALRLTPAPFHVEWQELCDQHDRLIIFAPPEHAKTTQLAILRSLWELGHNPDLRIALISETATQSEKSLGRIKANILYNERVRRVFPGLVPAFDGNSTRPSTWYQRAILVQRSQFAALAEKDYSIEAMGMGGAIMGSRIDLAILDDCVSWRNTITDASKRKVIEWFKDVLVGRMTKNGRVLIINNTWWDDDLMHVLEQEGMYTVRRYNAGEPPCVWPQVWPEHRLERRRAELGDVEYARQMLNVPLSHMTRFLPVDAIRECQALCDDPPHWWTGGYDDDSFSQVACGIDFGVDDEPGAALTAIATVSEDWQERKHLLNMRSGLWVGFELLREVVHTHLTMRPSEWLAETNGAQEHLASMIGMPGIMPRMAEELVKEGRLTDADARDCLARARPISVSGQFTTAAKKADERWGIRTLAPEFENHEWRIPKGRREVEELILELGRWRPSAHPGDRLIALWLGRTRLAGMGGVAYFGAESV